MTAAHDYEDLHRLVDRLTPDQAHALRAVRCSWSSPMPPNEAPPSSLASAVATSRLPA